MAGHGHPRRRAGPWTRRRSRVAVLTESLILASTVLAVVLILKPGPDAAHAEPEPPRAGPISVEVEADRLEGVARVIDGDTLDVGAVRVRLHGIDAFERNQMCDGPQGPWACGAAATRALKDRTEGRRLVCRVLDTDRYGRKVSRCEREGVDVARALVAEGLALAYRRYSQDYIDEELAARAGAAGAWSGSFDRPEQWRRRPRSIGPG
jgi:endonuclease YncB( thermonuclease family)